MITLQVVPDPWTGLPDPLPLPAGRLRSGQPRQGCLISGLVRGVAVQVQAAAQAAAVAEGITAYWAATPPAPGDSGSGIPQWSSGPFSVTLENGNTFTFSYDVTAV